MLHTFKQKPAYYSAHALRDGTIWFAVQGRKPSKKEKPIIDEDGIYQWFLDEDDPKLLSDLGKSLRHVAVANCLNTKRIVRKQVEKKLDRIVEMLGSIELRLDRLEQSRRGNSR